MFQYVKICPIGDLRLKAQILIAYFYYVIFPLVAQGTDFILIVFWSSVCIVALCIMRVCVHDIIYIVLCVYTIALYVVCNGLC